MSKALNPCISLVGKKNRVRISIDVIRMLGYPYYVCLYNTEKCDSIAVGPCDEKNVMSFKVPEKMLRGEKCDCEICSKQFVDMIMYANQLERDKTYRFTGVLHNEKNRITFLIAQGQKE